MYAPGNNRLQAPSHHESEAYYKCAWELTHSLWLALYARCTSTSDPEPFRRALTLVRNLQKSSDE